MQIKFTEVRVPDMYILKHKLLERIQILVLPDGVLRGQEDCLMLNIFVPEHAFESSLPVMAWIHGGSLKHGSNRVKNLQVAQSAFVFGILCSQKQIKQPRNSLGRSTRIYGQGSGDSGNKLQARSNWFPLNGHRRSTRY